jgi:mannosyl-glycoprotein endo-beta-N-acetylglucosaminidase
LIIICISIIISSPILEQIDLIVKNLIEIVLHYGFDGYLINIENRLPISLIEPMIYFVDCLTKELSLVLAHAQIIWYDAVTIEGKLEWQNQLNQLNKPFFDVCDGIFLNYCW